MLITLVHLLQWLFHTDAGLLTRVSIGCIIFASLAVTDLRRNGSAAQRWREYMVLLVAVFAALIYGAINDQITCTISPEYFLYGKELDKVIGDSPPMAVLRWEAAKVGFKATWSAGLTFGVILLLMNNPYGQLPRLRNRQLLMGIPVIVCTAALLGVVGGLLGYHGFLTRLSIEFKDMVEANLYRPRRFMCTWGVHLGGYAGGFLGTFIAAALVLRQRLNQAR